MNKNSTHLWFDGVCKNTTFLSKMYNLQMSKYNINTIQKNGDCQILMDSVVFFKSNKI